MAPTGPGERAIHLPWLWPDAASFHALANHSDNIPWSLVRSDPGLLFFLLARDVPVADPSPIRLDEGDLRAAAAMFADSASPWTDWSAPGIIGIELDSEYDFLRSSPRFQALLAKLGAIEPDVVRRAAK